LKEVFMKTKVVFLGLAVLSLTWGPLFAQEEEESSGPDKVSLKLEFNAPVVSVDSDGVFDSLVDAGFDDEESGISLGYERELFGGAASLKFSPESLRLLDGDIGDMFGDGPLSLDELFVWVKPFGSYFKFTGGVFENTDGVADYTDDIDIYGMGVFIIGEEGPVGEPEATSDPSLTNGFLTDLSFGPVTVQFLLAPNYSKESASGLANTLLVDHLNAASGGIPYVIPAVDAEKRFFRLGGRVIADLGPATVSALFKTFQWPMQIMNVAQALETGALGTYQGSKVNFNTFGIYADITAIENLGISFGYTGYTFASNASGVDNIFWSGIDLRAAWTGLEGLSVSTHNNISFAPGAKNDWFWGLNDSSFFSLFNAVGLTKELSERFSVNGELANIFAKYDSTIFGDVKYDNLSVGVKLITKVTEHAEFKAGLTVDIEKSKGADVAATFSVPLGIAVTF
jgi:hypothetical protein